MNSEKLQKAIDKLNLTRKAELNVWKVYANLSEEKKQEFVSSFVNSTK